MTNKIRINPKSQSWRNQDRGSRVGTLVVGTFIETPMFSDFSTREILWFSLMNGRTSSRKGTRSYAKLKNRIKDACIRDPGLQESRTSVGRGRGRGGSPSRPSRNRDCQLV